GEVIVDGRQVLGVQRLPAGEPRVGDVVRQDPVRDHGVHGGAEQRQVGVRAPRLGDDQPLRVHHQPHARAGPVREDLAHAREPVVEPSGGGEQGGGGGGEAVG